MFVKMLNRMACLASLAASLSAAAVQVADVGRDGIGITVDAEPETIDLARDFLVTVTVTSPGNRIATPADLRTRFEGFKVVEDLAEIPAEQADGQTVSVTRWRLKPEPLARRYRLRPFTVDVAENGAVVQSFNTSPVAFAPPADRAPVEGEEMEVAPTRDLPPLTWRLVGICLACLLGVGALGAVLWVVVRKIREMVRIHRMSPIERALHELDQLLRKGLPGRGFYKDFYVELTMVVRRYIERRHRLKAPNLTTQEFLEAAQANPAFTPGVVAELKNFLESSDLIKFAGVQATPELADQATDRARNYLTADATVPVSGR